MVDVDPGVPVARFDGDAYETMEQGVIPKAEEALRVVKQARQGARTKESPIRGFSGSRELVTMPTARDVGGQGSNQKKKARVSTINGSRPGLTLTLFPFASRLAKSFGFIRETPHKEATRRPKPGLDFAPDFFFKAAEPRSGLVEMNHPF